MRNKRGKRGTAGGTPPAVRLLTLCAVAAVLLLGPAPTAHSSPSDARRSCSYGVYVHGLRDFDVERGTFAVDFTLWSLCDRSSRTGAAEHFWTVNGVSTRLGPVRVSDTPAGHYRAVRVKGVFRKSWSMADYPFDRQVLQLVIGVGYATTSDVRASAATADSGIAPGLGIDGLRVRGFRVTPGYLTTAYAGGDPTYDPRAPVRWNTLTATVVLARQDWTSLVPLQAPLWAGVIASAVNYLFTLRITSVLLGRLGLAGAAVLTIVFNSQQAHEQLSTTELTSVDLLMIAGLVYACASAAVTALTWRLITKGATDDAVRRLNRWCFLLTTTSYLGATAVILWLAQHGGGDPHTLPITPCPGGAGACMTWP
ncbi:hypothetical protein ABT160_42200 [Streptomyces sp. NPDC001941]|uniref:hypothetical protein n=1 Tax=Streptomyces sp. NPDC001941 TaxID=3154659 RepID=UPI00331996FA